MDSGSASRTALTVRPGCARPAFRRRESSTSSADTPWRSGSSRRSERPPFPLARGQSREPPSPSDCDLHATQRPQTNSDSSRRLCDSGHSPAARRTGRMMGGHDVYLLAALEIGWINRFRALRFGLFSCCPPKRVRDRCFGLLETGLCLSLLMPTRHVMFRTFRRGAPGRPHDMKIAPFIVGGPT
jgi:hypothetical protein